MRVPSTVPEYMWDVENRPAVCRRTPLGYAITAVTLAAPAVMTMCTGHVMWLAILPLVALPRVDQWVSMRFMKSWWMVYYLRDVGAELLYIGSTNDLPRRLNEHTDDRSEAWKRTIRHYTIARVCRSEKQARRIEERRIRAVTVAARHAWCPPLRNKTWSTTAPKGLGILAARLWSWAYIVESAVYNEARFHTLPRKVWTVPLRPEADEPPGEDWAETETISDDPIVDSPTHEATYMRPERPERMAIALGPARPRTFGSADASDSGPPKGDSNVHATSPASEAERLLAERRAKDAQRKRDKRQASKTGNA